MLINTVLSSLYILQTIIITVSSYSVMVRICYNDSIPRTLSCSSYQVFYILFLHEFLFGISNWVVTQWSNRVITCQLFKYPNVQVSKSSEYCMIGTKLSNHYIFMSLPVAGKCQRCTNRMPSHMASVRLVSSIGQVTWLAIRQVSIRDKSHG